MDYTSTTGSANAAGHNLSTLPGSSLASSDVPGGGLFDSFDTTPQCLQCDDSGYVWRDWYGRGLQRECCPFCPEGELRESEAAQ